MTTLASDLTELYRRYIACLNARDLDQLGGFVDDAVEYGGEPVGLDGYRRMLEGNYRNIPDLVFTVQMTVAGEGRIAARLKFDCTPVGRFLDLPINGRRVCFHENVIYAFENGRIRRVWSVIDKGAIEKQLRTPPAIPD